MKVLLVLFVPALLLAVYCQKEIVASTVRFEKIALMLIKGMIAIFLPACILFLYKQRIRLYMKSIKLPPGPPSLPLIGNAHYFIGKSQDSYKKYKKLLVTYSSPFHFWLAHRLFYIVHEPEQLKTILLSPNAIEKEDVHKFSKPWVGNGLISATPASIWKVHRKIINPTFNPRILDSFVEVFSAKSEILIKQMEVEVDGDEFDIFSYVSLCTLDIICETAMGVSSKAQTDKHCTYVKVANELFRLIALRASKLWLFPDFIFNNTKYGEDMRECVKYIHGYTDNVIKRRKLAVECNAKDGNTNSISTSAPGRGKAFLDLLMELSNEGNKFTDEELRDEVNTMIITGNDTTATTSCFVMLMLASHPEIQDKVYKELWGIYGSEDPYVTPVKSEDLHKMEYLERVIKETLRIFPVVPNLFRKLTDDVNIGEYTLMKGSSLALGVFGTHRSEKYWNDPLTFNPDRFLPEECAKRHPYAYLPFSAGPRNCIGLKYGMMAMKVILATVLRKYVIKKDKIIPIQDIELRSNYVLKPIEPIKIRIERINHEDSKQDQFLHSVYL